jgi:hypothetical protein
MARLNWTISNAIRSLTIALAVVCTVADALPIPIVEVVGFCPPGGAPPFTPNREDERDETPDDATGLAWPVVDVAAPVRSEEPFGGTRRRLRASVLLSGRDVSGELRRSGRDPSLTGSPRRLTIRLCRLTC